MHFWVDAGGVDWNGKTVAVGPNPETGPFFVDGAEPGDMLVVRIERIETNRATAYSGTLIAPYAIDPGYLRQGEREARHCWVFDPVDGTTNYAHGLPIYCSAASLEIDGQPVVAAIYDPTRRELFTAERSSNTAVLKRNILM